MATSFRTSLRRHLAREPLATHDDVGRSTALSRVPSSSRARLGQSTANGRPIDFEVLVVDSRGNRSSLSTPFSVRN